MSEKETIQQELEKISPWLALQSKETPYQVSSAYWEISTLQLKQKISHEANDYQVPAQYFEDFAENLKKKINDDTFIGTKQESRPKKRVQMMVVFRWAVAASLLIVFGWLILPNKFWKSNEEITKANESDKNINHWEQQLESLSDAEMLAFLEENGHDVEAALVASYSETETSEAELDFLLSDEWIEPFKHNSNNNEP